MKKAVSLILAALMLASAAAVYAEETEAPEQETEITEPQEQEESASENEPDAETVEEGAETPPQEQEPGESEEPQEAGEPQEPVEETPASEPAEETETPEAELIAEETQPAADEKEDKVYSVTIADQMLEKGYAMPSRRTAKEGDVVILTAFEKEYEKDGKNFRQEFERWTSDSAIPIISVNRTAAFFYMPDHDVTIYPVFKTVDVTEYYDWDSVVKAVSKLHRNETYFVDLEDETVIPDGVLEALAGKDADVTFTTADCIFTVNGGDIRLNEKSGSGYSLTYEDYTLSRLQSRRIRYTDLLAVKVSVKTNHTVTASLRGFAGKNVKSGYLYRVNGLDFEFLSSVSVDNGEVLLPVTESGVYVVTSQALEGVRMAVPVKSDKTVVTLGGRLIPLSAVSDGNLFFKTETNGRLTFSEYTNPYTDIKNHRYKSQIEFVCARGLLDGIGADSFEPNAGITTGEFMRAIARLRGIPDKDAYDYCTQLDIFTYEYVEDDLLGRNEMSVIFTNFINHLIEYPKSFGGYSMKAFDDNGAAWVGARFRELKSESGDSFDWKANATRAEAAYLLQAAVTAAVTGDAE